MNLIGRDGRTRRTDAQTTLGRGSRRENKKNKGNGRGRASEKEN
jgi:hypothetical protein